MHTCTSTAPTGTSHRLGTGVGIARAILRERRAPAPFYASGFLTPSSRRYSSRSTVTASVETARNAGRALARNAAAINTAVAVANAATSWGTTP